MYSADRRVELTRDLDFGFALSDWKQFETLKTALIATGRFKADRAIQRVLYPVFR